MQVAEDVEKFGGTAKARQDFPQSIMADSIKGLGQVYETCIKTYVLFSTFLLYLSQQEDHVPLLGLNPHWLSGMFSCAIVGISLFIKTQAKILLAMDSRVMLQ